MSKDIPDIDIRRLDRISQLITHLKQLVGGSGELIIKKWPLPVVEALQSVLICNWLKNFTHFITEETVWTSMSAQKQLRGKQLLEWIKKTVSSTPFSAINNVTTNIVGNEEYLIYEHGVSARHTDGMQFKGSEIHASNKQINWQGADVLKIQNGKLVSIQHYSDCTCLMIQLGLMQNVMMGHDEAPVSPHTDASMALSAEMKDARRSGPFFGGISLGSGQTKRAKQNIENCKGIHEAFVNDTPGAFDKLIAKGSVWIDAPTGVILDGALAAAHHDHSNWSRAFTDNDATVHNIISNDEWSIVQHRGEGTHLGELQLGGHVFEPTGKKVAIYVLDCVKLNSDGKASLIRNYYDVGSMMYQLGVINKFLL